MRRIIHFAAQEQGLSLDHVCTFTRGSPTVWRREVINFAFPGSICQEADLHGKDSREKRLGTAPQPHGKAVEITLRSLPRLPKNSRHKSKTAGYETEQWLRARCPNPSSLLLCSGQAQLLTAHISVPLALKNSYEQYGDDCFHSCIYFSARQNLVLELCVRKHTRLACVQSDIMHVPGCHLLAYRWPRASGSEQATAQRAEISMELHGSCHGCCSTGSCIWEMLMMCSNTLMPAFPHRVFLF